MHWLTTHVERNYLEFRRLSDRQSDNDTETIKIIENTIQYDVYGKYNFFFHQSNAADTICWNFFSSHNTSFHFTTRDYYGTMNKFKYGNCLSTINDLTKHNIEYSKTAECQARVSRYSPLVGREITYETVQAVRTSFKIQHCIAFECTSKSKSRLLSINKTSFRSSKQNLQINITKYQNIR